MGGGAGQAKFHTILLPYTISNVVIYFRMFYYLEHKILTESMNDALFRGVNVMKIRFAVTLAVLGSYI